jgi:hypothetical protein
LSLLDNHPGLRVVLKIPAKAGIHSSAAAMDEKTR